MNLTIIIFTILGIIFSRDIYLLLKKFLKTLKYFLVNIFNYLDKKFKLKKFIFLLGRLLDKIWNFDKYLSKNNLDKGLVGVFIFFPFLVIKLIASFFLFTAVLFVSSLPITLFGYLIYIFTPYLPTSFLAYPQYFIFETFGDNIFSVLAVFIVWLIIGMSIFYIGIYIVSRLAGLYRRYFISEKKSKKN